LESGARLQREALDREVPGQLVPGAVLVEGLASGRIGLDPAVADEDMDAIGQGKAESRTDQQGLEGLAAAPEAPLQIEPSAQPCELGADEAEASLRDEGGP